MISKICNCVFWLLVLWSGFFFLGATLAGPPEYILTQGQRYLGSMILIAAGLVGILSFVNSKS